MVTWVRPVLAKAQSLISVRPVGRFRRERRMQSRNAAAPIWVPEGVFSDRGNGHTVDLCGDHRGLHAGVAAGDSAGGCVEEDPAALHIVSDLRGAGGSKGG